MKTRPKPTADLWLATETGAPLLATWRYGLGKAGAFTSDARNRWAIDWLRWPSFDRFWAGVFRHLLREADLGNLPATLTAREGRLQLQVEAIDRDGRYLPDASGSIHLLLPSGERASYPRATAPGTLATDWPGEPGTHVARIILTSEGETFASRTLLHDVGFPAEYLLEPASTEDLAILAESTGGTLEPTLADLTRNDRTVRAEKELWPWLLILVLLLFPLDVALKRIPNRQ